MHCQLVDRNDEVHAGLRRSSPSTCQRWGLPPSWSKMPRLPNLHARADAGDEQAKASSEEKAQQWDDNKLKRTYGFDQDESEKTP